MEAPVMKIIDAHTHFPGSESSFPGRRFGNESGLMLRRQFEEDGLAGAWIMTSDGLRKDPVRHNDILARALGKHRDFFTPFCTVGMHESLEDIISELERCAVKLKMRGLKLHPWLQAFSMTHTNVPAVLDKAGKLGMPVLFHDGTPPYSAPLQIAWAAEQVPKTTIILGHAGLDDLWEDAILACRRHDNIFLCLCSLSAGHIREIIRRCPVEKLLFGSDGGFMPGIAKHAIAKIRCTGASQKVLRRILYDNPLRLLPPARDAEQKNRKGTP